MKNLNWQKNLFILFFLVFFNSVYAQMINPPVNNCSDILSPYMEKKHFINEANSKFIRTHHGVDFDVPVGTEIVSPLSGKVIYSGLKSGYGNLIILQHDNNIKTLYAHLSKISVNKGDMVIANQMIGLSGDTGKVTQPHLHWEVIKNNKYIDPMKILSCQ